MRIRYVLNYYLDAKSSSQENKVSNIWSPHQNFPWRSAFNKDHSTILAHKVTEHKLSPSTNDNDTTTNLLPQNTLTLAPLRVLDVTSLLSTVQPWLNPNNVIAKAETHNKSSSTNTTADNNATTKPIIAETVDLITKKPPIIPESTTIASSADNNCPPGLNGIFDRQSVKCKRSTGNTNLFGLQPFPDLNSETSAERAVRMQKDIQRLMHFVTVVGHVDSFLTKRFRSGLKKMAKLYESEEVNLQKRPRRRISF